VQLANLIIEMYKRQLHKKVINKTTFSYEKKMHFKDKIIWITGASSGIGKELAIQLANKVILTSSNLTSLQLKRK
jgi:3-oxoacyl-ACP reductase-like protein